MDESDERCRWERVRSLAEELHRREHHRLLAIARRNSDAGVDVEAELQDAFLLFLERYDPFTAESEPLPWLILTLKRRCWAAYRRQRSFRDRLELAAVEETCPSTSPDPTDALIRAEQARAGLAGMKPAERAALSLLAFGYSYREICRVTGWSERKVMRSIYEGRLALRADDPTCGPGGSSRQSPAA